MNNDQNPLGNASGEATERGFGHKDDKEHSKLGVEIYI